MAASEEQFLSLEDVASRLQVSDQTVRRWVKAGKLAAYKPGLEYRIKGSDLEEFLKTREVSPKVQSPLPDLEVERSPRDEQRRHFHERIKDLDSRALEKLRDEEYAQYARLYSEWKEAAAEDPTSARSAMLASQVDMTASFALMASLQLRITENPGARFAPIQPETRLQVEREVEQDLEALRGAA